MNHVLDTELDAVPVGSVRFMIPYKATPLIKCQERQY
jgi:hypothetical protein